MEEILHIMQQEGNSVVGTACSDAVQFDIENY